jgi:hypothetical protein
VSPENARAPTHPVHQGREEGAADLRHEISDRQMIKLLQERVKAGVNVPSSARSPRKAKA